MAIHYDDMLSVPWQCGDRDCEYKWHMSCYSYCEDSGNLLVSNYNDGDWEDCDYDLPSDEETRQAWHDYAVYVVKTGEDPLDAYYVEYSRTTQQKWQVWMKLRVVGVVLLGCRRNSRGDWHRNPPKELVEFMGWKQARDGGWRLDEDLYERAEYCDILRNSEGEDWTPQRSTSYEFKGIARMTVQIDRPDNRVRQDLRRVARKDLKRMDLYNAQVLIPDPPEYAWHLMRSVDGKEHTIGVFRPSDGQDVMGCDMDEWMWENGYYGEHSPDDYEWDGDSESVAIMAKREGMPEYRFERKEIS